MFDKHFLKNVVLLYKHCLFTSQISSKQRNSLAFSTKQNKNPNKKTYELEHVLFKKKTDRKKECLKNLSLCAIYTILFVQKV